ncbi:MAG: 30S ribosomal protein S6 [Patescibacteria group bacterium]
MSTRYELLYILPTTLTDDEVGGTETKINALLTKLGATIESTKRLGKFKLAYAINRQRHGHYVLVHFTAERTAMAKIDEILRITSDIVRHLILRADEAGDQKYNLVQFTEVVVENTRDERRRREKQQEREDKEGAAKAEEKAGEVKEGEKKEEAPVVEAPKTDALSAEELELKIDKALTEDIKGI